MSNRRPAGSPLLIESSDDSNNKQSKQPVSEAVETALPPDSSTQSQLARSDEGISSTCATTIQLQRFAPMRRSRCSHLCRCRCHTSQRRSRKVNWAIPFLGSFLADYRSAPRTQQAACSDKDCSGTTDTIFELKYYSPAWLWEGMVSFGASYHKAAGLRVALRPKRVLPWSGSIVCDLFSPLENFKDGIRNEVIRFYPDDETENQGSIIEVGYKLSSIQNSPSINSASFFLQATASSIWRFSYISGSNSYQGKTFRGKQSFLSGYMQAQTDSLIVVKCGSPRGNCQPVEI